MANAKPQNPWDALPREEEGAPDSAVLFAAVGQALSTWEIMEGHLGTIFAELCGTEEEAAYRAYGMVPSSFNRIGMLLEAYACSSARPLIEDAGFPRLLKDIGRYAARRNEIAHGHATHSTRDDVDRGYFWVPSHYNSKKRLSQAELMKLMTEDWTEYSEQFMGSYAYNAKQIDYYREEFEKLSARALEIHSLLFRGRLESMRVMARPAAKPGP